MLGSPCSACCNICGIDWSQASSVEVEIEAVDYYSRWHGRQLIYNPSDTRDFYYSLGLKGSRFNGTFSLTRVQGTFFTPGLSQWEYRITDTPQMCSIVSGTAQPPGIYLTAYMPDTAPAINGQQPAVVFNVQGTASSYVSRGAASFTELADMTCREFVRDQPWRGSYYVPCTAPVSRVGGGFDATQQTIASALPGLEQAMFFSFSLGTNEGLSYGWSGSGFGEFGKDPFDWYGGFEVVRDQIFPPDWINVHKLQSTYAADPQKAPDLGGAPGLAVPVAQIVTVKRISVRL